MRSVANSKCRLSSTITSARKNPTGTNASFNWKRGSYELRGRQRHEETVPISSDPHSCPPPGHSGLLTEGLGLSPCVRVVAGGSAHLVRSTRGSPLEAVLIPRSAGMLPVLGLVVLPASTLGCTNSGQPLDGLVD